MSDLFGRAGTSQADRSAAAGIDEEAAPRSRETGAAQASRANLFAQASHVADSLRSQVSELERRERNLNEQLAQFDKEQRALRLRAQAAEEESRARAEQLAQQEQDFAARFEATEQLLSELKLREKELTQKNAELEQQRSTLKQQLERQIEVDKATYHHSTAMAESERKQLTAERERLQREQLALLDTVKAEIQQEKARLRKEYAWELDGEIENFRLERENWAKQQTQERAKLEDDRRLHDEAVRRIQAEWAEQRRSQQSDLDSTKRHLEQQRAQYQREHEEALRRLQLNWESERQQLRAQWGADLDEERRQFAIEKSEFTANTDAERAVLQRERDAHDGYIQQSLGELKRQRDEHSQKMQLAAIELEQTKAAWQREQHAQQSVLAAREQELNADKDRLAKSWQAAEAEIVRRHQDLDLRATQLTTFRERLADREAALDREAEAWQKLLAVKSSEVDSDHRRLERERSEWDQRRKSEESALQQGQERLLQEFEKLDARRQRLELMRAEMDNTTRLALEARIATEETWAEMVPQIDPELARRRIDAGRGAIAEHYRRLRDELEFERQSLSLERLQSTDELRRDQEKLRLEREQLPSILAFREEQIRLGEQRLRTEIAEWESRESRWQASRSQWHLQRLEAEQIIRGLLVEVEAAQANSLKQHTARSSAVTPAVAPQITTHDFSTQQIVTQQVATSKKSVPMTIVVRPAQKKAA